MIWVITLRLARSKYISNVPTCYSSYSNMRPCWPNLTQIRPTLPLFPRICPPCLRYLGGPFPCSLWGHFLNWYTFGWLSFVLLFEALIYRSVKFYKIGPWWDVFSCYSESHFYLWCPAFSNVSNLALICRKLGRDQAREVPWPKISRPSFILKVHLSWLVFIWSRSLIVIISGLGPTRSEIER